MPRDRIIPLIIAVALFMENMDSTVIATSLPAIAADIGTNPLALKLAVTSYLLSLAIFIPASGWTADRFGARTVFRAAIAVFVIGSIGCALSSSLTHFVIARIVQGIGGAMMTPVGRLVLVRTISKRELVGAMVWVTTPALVGPVLGPPIGGLDHDLCDLALDIHHQRADRPARYRAGNALHPGCARRTPRTFRCGGHGARRPRHRRLGVRTLGARIEFPAVVSSSSGWFSAGPVSSRPIWRTPGTRTIPRSISRFSGYRLFSPASSVALSFALVLAPFLFCFR